MSTLALSTVDVPLELVKNYSSRIAIDHGCSAFKAVYITKQNREDAAKKSTGTTPVTLLVVEGSKFSEGLDHLAQHASINEQVPSDEIYTTGVGCAVNAKVIEEKLGAKVNNLSEYDAMIKALIYLTHHLTRSEIFHCLDHSRLPKPYIMVDLVRGQLEDPNTGLKGMNMEVLNNPKSVIESFDWSSKQPLAKEEKDYFPCLLVHIGSGLDFIKVNADGTFTLLDGSGRGGLSFLGLASLLVEVQSFDELLKLAEKGNPKNVDLYSDSFELEPSVGAEVDMYSMAMTTEASAIYCFGKCVGAKLGDFKREDLARSLLDHFINDITQTTMSACAAGGLKRACLSGSFVSSKLVRDLIVDWMDRRNVFYRITGKPTIGLDFLKSAGHIGALGALITQHEKFSENSKY